MKFYLSLIQLLFAPRYRGKRVLGIWDFKALPWSVGDPLIFIEVLSVLKLRYGGEEVDICVIYDCDNPGGNRAKMDKNQDISPKNAQDYNLEFLPLFSTCPYLGSIYQFNSRTELRRFLKNNIERYDVFPRLAEYLGETYNYYGGSPDVNLIQEFYHDYGYIPHLRIGDRNECWAMWFYLNHLRDNAIPVVLSLKQTSHAQIRNANLEVWLAFIDQCKISFPNVIFVCVGLKEEISNELKNRLNVLVAKDFGTSIIEDLALIRTSFIYMGTNSGVNTIAWFSDIPYLLFQWPVYTLHKYGLEPDENFNFANDKQKIFSSNVLVTPELLFAEFSELYFKCDKEKWLCMNIEKASNKKGHPSALVDVKKSQNESIINSIR
jgi:hypothetical protein